MSECSQQRSNLKDDGYRMMKSVTLFGAEILLAIQLLRLSLN
ncbi:hypothetical protein [Photorhabdus bodei]|uniref:Uncharacterized protein n=1 Tax=Photorhabdus bodei TaxID=2029681 RepID=A0AAW6BQ53_9GAMM|nr:hypothetical protein [Photorhabdus bodei]MDB6374966.1 hypothetical protein [Photorhabdus bodei]